MIPKKYSSFDEIDERLKILNLQREIYRESIKLNLNRAKTNLYPSRFMGGVGGLLQKVLITLIIKKLSGLFRSRNQKDLLE